MITVSTSPRTRLRQERLSARAALPAAFRKQASAEIAANLAALPELRAAHVLAVYLSLPEEVSTAPLISYLQNLQVRPHLVAPVTLPGRQLAFYALPDEDSDLRPGKFGIPEPPTEGLSPISPDSIDVMLVPGVAFDSAGHRLGYGAGYYDRYLGPLKKEEASDAVRLPASFEPLYRPPLLIGVAFAVQLLPSIPQTPQDVAVDLLVTERGVERVLRV